MPGFLVWLIPLLLVIGVAFFFAFQSYFRKQAELELKSMSQALRHFQAEKRSIDARAQFFSLRDPEPYKSRSIRIKATQANLRKKIEELEQRRIVLNENAVQLRKRGVRTFLTSPLRWRSIQAEANRLKIEIAGLQSSMAQISSLESELRNLPWLVAQQARLLQSRLQEVSEILSRLEQAGLMGDTYEKAGVSAGQIRASLARIPAQFIESDEASIQSETNKESVSLVHEILSANQLALDELLNQLKSWDAAVSEALAKVAKMSRTLGELQQAISHLPSQLDLSEERSGIRQLEVIAQNLEASATRMEVETIPLVCTETERVIQSAAEQLALIQRSLSELSSLEALQSELSTGFRDASIRLAALAARSSHPVQSDASLEKLASLNRQSRGIANGLAQRTLQELNQDLSKLNELNIQQKELIRQIEKLEGSQAELSKLLESPEFKRLPKWINETQTLAHDMAEYAPENWSRLDDIPGFGKALMAFVVQAEHLVNQVSTRPVPETELPEALKQTEALAQEYHRLSVLAESFSRRMSEMTVLEQRSRETLEDQRKFLNQIRLIAKSNPFLTGSGLEEIERFLKSIQAALTELEKLQQGTVEKKARLASELALRVEAAAFRWLELLNKECQNRLKELSALLGNLDSIGVLEDASVAECRRLLASDEARQSTNPSRRSPAGIDELILAFKRRSDLWQECAAARKSMENIGQLLETHQQSDTLRQETRQLIRGLAGTAPYRRSWPPTSVTFETETMELDQLEKEWAELREHTGKAITLVARYSNLGSLFKNLSQRAQQSGERREQEQEFVEKLDDEIFELAQPWQDLQIQYRDNIEASREIGEMLRNLDHSMKDIERGYLRGEIDYDEVVDEMKAIQRRVRYYQVALDDEHALDASGRVSRRR